MVLPDNVKPESSILYLSSFILEILKSSKEVPSVSSLYDAVQKLHEMSIHEFLLCLDWLFLMNIAYTDEEGVMRLCS